MLLKVGLRTITTMQANSVYKETWPASPGDPWPEGADAATNFYDSSGALITSIQGEVTSKYVTFLEQPESVEQVPNGAGFEVIVTDEEGPHCIRYGTVFRRQLTFTDSPAITPGTTPRRYESDFAMRTAGAVGGDWTVFVGRPLIYDQSGSLPNTVGVQYDFFTRYWMRYYVPFNSDSIDLSVSLLRKGAGKTVIAVASASDSTSYLYAGFDASNNTIEVGNGTGPDLGTVASPTAVLTPRITPVSLTVSNSAAQNFKVRYDNATKTLSLYNTSYTTLYGSWTDSTDIVPHGKGHRYFAVGANSAAANSGIQVSYIAAQDQP